MIFVNYGAVSLVTQRGFRWLWANRKEVLSKLCVLVSATLCHMPGQFLRHHHVTAHSQGLALRK